MTIYEDTRQKATEHQNKHQYWDRHNISIVRQVLSCGDYMLDPNGTVSIDTKQNILELANNMFCDSVRFQKECIRAKVSGIKLIFLIEEKFDKDKLLNWRSPKDVNGKRYMNVYGWQIYNEMKRYSQLYNCMFRCCHKKSSGKVILDLLNSYNK